MWNLYFGIGNHVTLVSHSKAVQSCLEAAKELTGSGIDAEVVNLRSLRPLGMIILVVEQRHCYAAAKI